MNRVKAKIESRQSPTSLIGEIGYYADFDFHLKSFNHFINDAKLPTNRNNYFEGHMDPISFHLCAAWMTLTPFSHQRLTDTFRCALPEVVGGAS